EELKNKLVAKIEDATLEVDDLRDFMTLEMQICNENEEIQEEVKNFNCVYQFLVDGADNAWIKIQDGVFTFGPGLIENPDVTLEMDSDIAIGIYTGEIDSTTAYMDNELNVKGPLPNAVKFRTITEIVREILGLD
ncbi:MAG: hypothetical protein GF364_20815, partial [Candidatus Lokiarchaeota archaeon]|nr:hypothetical protein [Candidatus Lokiarchaeota archaeon]